MRASIVEIVGLMLPKRDKPTLLPLLWPAFERFFTQLLSRGSIWEINLKEQCIQSVNDRKDVKEKNSHICSKDNATTFHCKE